MPTTPSYFEPRRKPSWRLTVTVLYLRVRQARTLLGRVASEFGVGSSAELQARAVLSEASSALDAVRRLPMNASAGKWRAVS
jgi:hypothetical protein